MAEENTTRTVNYKKDRFLGLFESSNQMPDINDVGTSTNDFHSKQYLMKTEIETTIKKLEEWEKTKITSLERLAYLIDVIKAKKLEVRHKEMEVLNKIRTQRNTIGIDNSILLEAKFNELFDMEKQQSTLIAQKRKFKKSFDDLHNNSKGFHKFPTNFNCEFNDEESDFVKIGPNGTIVPKIVLKSINWSSATIATRNLLMAVFDRETLAFHTLTGKPSPAFIDCDIPIKNQLDPLKVRDIIYMVTKYSGVTEREVKMVITTKCADENKMWKMREKRKIKNQNKYRNAPL